MRRKRIAIVSTLSALGIFFFVLPALVERQANRLVGRSSLRPSEAAVLLHRKLLVADLHCDALLWNRDLLERNAHGHIDVPRLLEGNVALQAFTIVTKVPFGLNISERSEDTFDVITPLVIAQRWPMATWGSLCQRVLYQAKKLHDFASRSDGKLVLIKTAADFRAYLDRRKNDQNITAGYLGVEGAHALDGDLANLNVLFDAGIRMMAPTHFLDNELGGASSGVNKGELTAMGKEMIRRMEEKGMILDLAHASPKTIDDALAIVTRPVVVSHTGVRGTCDNNRNISDDQIVQIAKTGGVIGIGYWKTAVCGTDAGAIAKAIRHVTNLAGVVHVGLGSDFDGAVPTPFDATGLARLTEALLAEGFAESEIALIMGGNIIRVLLEALP